MAFEQYLKTAKQTFGGKALMLAKQAKESGDTFLCMTILKGLNMSFDNVLQMNTVTFEERTNDAGMEFIIVKSTQPKSTHKLESLNDYISFMETNNISNIIWVDNCPIKEASALNHGGDEDYIILTNTKMWKADRVIDILTVADHNTVKCVDKEDFSLSVTAHA